MRSRSPIPWNLQRKGTNHAGQNWYESYLRSHCAESVDSFPVTYFLETKKRYYWHNWAFRQWWGWCFWSRFTQTFRKHCASLSDRSVSAQKSHSMSYDSFWGLLMLQGFNFWWTRWGSWVCWVLGWFGWFGIFITWVFAGGYYFD